METLLQKIIWLPASKAAKGSLAYLKIAKNLTMANNPHHSYIKFWRTIYRKFGKPPFDTYWDNVFFSAFIFFSFSINEIYLTKILISVLTIHIRTSGARWSTNVGDPHRYFRSCSRSTFFFKLHQHKSSSNTPKTKIKLSGNP